LDRAGKAMTLKGLQVKKNYRLNYMLMAFLYDSGRIEGKEMAGQ